MDDALFKEEAFTAPLLFRKIYNHYNEEEWCTAESAVIKEM